jgi:transposase-like protein
MMAERGISVDHSTVHRWAIKLLPVLEKEFRRSKRKVGRSWRMDETYIKVIDPAQKKHHAVPHPFHVFCGKDGKPCCEF